MVNYNVALVAILALSSTRRGGAFLASRSGERTLTSIPRHISASSAFDQFDPYSDGGDSQGDDQSQKLRAAVENLENFGESLTEAILRDEVQDAQDERMLELRKQRVRERLSPRGWLVTMSLAGTIGVTLAQVGQGRRLAPEALDLDSLSYRSVASTELLEKTETHNAIDEQSLLEAIDDNFSGLVVQSVEIGSQSWTAGIRPGNILVATSATVGDGLWPKTTLEGVKASMASRKLVSSQLVLKLQRSCAEAPALDNLYELTLTRPLGLEIDEDSAGYVFVSGFNENSSNLVLKGVKIGDRILAVGSSVGGSMWPVSTVEGVISACTARLPGQKVTMRFERPSTNLDCVANDVDYKVSENKLVPGSGVAVAVAQQKAVSVMLPQQQKVLLQRCREVLKRYWSTSKTDFVGKNEIPVMVADKVVDAIASASASFDAVTLSMVMNAYLSCDQPDAAIRIFQAATGFRADGALGETGPVICGKEQGALVAKNDALNLHTASSVMHAFAVKGDLSSAKRILAAIEGQGGLSVGHETVASWPGTGVNGSIQSDTVAYNTALAAAAASEEGISALFKIFSTMSDRQGHGRRPAKDVVSYNTVIAALDKAGKSEQAFGVFSTMKQNGIKPDKFTYTSLVKSCTKPIDMQELLYDMKELGAKPDIVTYNTIIRTLCDRLQWYEAKKMITDMESSGVVPNSLTYGFLMTGLMKAGKHSACLSLFEAACADSRTMPLTENVHLYTTAISAAASLKNHEKAFHLVNRMKAAGVRPNMKTMSALMGACLSSSMTSLAVEVYKQIEAPDGLAMSKGLEAMCLEGHFDDVAATLFDQWSRRGNAMSGKQIMDAYTILMRQALAKGDMESARAAFRQFLKCGYIPSKVMYRAMIEGLGLVPPRARDLPFAKVIPTEHFNFLLFVLDAIRDRNLPCDGAFYASLLHCSSRLGGLGRKLGSLLTEARALSKGTEIEPNGKSTAGDESGSVSWEDLMLNYDTYKESKTTQLPRFVVSVNKDMVRQVLNAEQLVIHHKYRKSLTQRKLKAQSLAPPI